MKHGHALVGMFAVALASAAGCGSSRDEYPGDDPGGASGGVGGDMTTRPCPTCSWARAEIDGKSAKKHARLAR